MKKKGKAQPIGFLQGSRPPSPFSSASPFAPGPGAASPPAAAPPLGNQGGGGLFQGLLGGDMMTTIQNAQKMMNAVNQFAPMIRNLSPMLQLFNGLPIVATEEDSKALPAVSTPTREKRLLNKRKKRGHKVSRLRNR